MRYLKTYKLFESIDIIESDIKDIKEIMNDIYDLEDIAVYIEEDFEKIKIELLPPKTEFGYTFKINQNIKSIIQRLNQIYKKDYIFLYQYFNSHRWIKFYVYDDERGLRDSDTVRMDGSGKFPAPIIYRLQIIMVKKNNETSKVSESINIIESIDSDRIDIKEMMNDITDNYDVFSDFDRGYLTKSKEDYIIFSLNGEFSRGAFLKFTIDEYIESIFKRLNYTYSSEYNIKYYIHFFKNKKYQTKEFYVDEDGMFFKEENIFGYDSIEMIGVEPSSIHVSMSKKY
jgi:hypothetical protein